MSKCQEIALRFLSEWFRPEETFALLVGYPEATRSLQRIVRLPDLMTANYLGWLAFENSRGANIYFSINPLSFGAKRRTKSAAAKARDCTLIWIWMAIADSQLFAGSNAVPPLAAVIRTSIGKYQVIWRVKGFTIPEQEAMLKTLAETFGGDRACADCARVFRLPGFFNQKYSPAFPVTVEMQAAQSEHSPSDFGLELATSADVQPHRIDPATRLGSRGINAGCEGVIRRSIPGGSDDGASHRMNYDTPPLKGLRLEPFGSIWNHCKESIRCALCRFHSEPELRA
jgi:hypothetical protein